jgi:hypothetical protein
MGFLLYILGADVPCLLAFPAALSPLPSGPWQPALLARNKIPDKTIPDKNFFITILRSFFYC